MPGSSRLDGAPFRYGSPALAPLARDLCLEGDAALVAVLAAKGYGLPALGAL